MMQRIFINNIDQYQQIFFTKRQQAMPMPDFLPYLVISIII